MQKSTHRVGTQSVFAGIVAEMGRLGPVAALLNRLSNWKKRGKLIKLSELDDRLLNDIGLTRVDLVWARGLPLNRNPLTALDEIAHDRARTRHLGAAKILPGTRVPVRGLTPGEAHCG